MCAAKALPVMLLVCPCCFSKNSALVPCRSWTEGRTEKEVEVLTRLAESDHRTVSCRAMRLINSARLDVLRSGFGGAASLRLLAFPAEFSLRNQVLQAGPPSSVAELNLEMASQEHS
eukprot:TRINITY_DN39251_c0_g1_i1.p1 TRINITY_DN39251_c0_g1~~TRINITY_DN39251_c0_g1_i1.p1  ORF type:complete len:128 (+),score=19.72 TRINITY_DN39251_c0_g1_i1:34-384(+)